MSLEDLELINKLSRENRFLQGELKLALEGLDEIACWDEGEEVTGKFDEPSSTIVARETLAKIKSYKRIEW